MPSLRSLLVFAIALSWGCSSEPPAPPADAGQVDGGQQIDAAQDTAALPDTATTTAEPAPAVDPFACPGGHGCSCLQSADCLSGICTDLGQGKRCLRPCEDDYCGPSESCKPVTVGAVGGWFCVPAFENLCNPCKNSSECGGFGLKDAACVDYGDRGSFCGVSCRGDYDCDEGFACRTIQRVEGRSDLQCVRVDDLGLETDCSCSEAAKNAKMETTCGVSDGLGNTCPGTRSCGPSGLSDCSAKSPSQEACDGADNDCDGQTDEDACVDGNPCTDDSCDNTLGCINSQNTGPCDADGSVCTVGDVCKLGSCVAGVKKSCDDGNPCTTDACDAKTGCTYTAKDGEACDADGEPCTVGDACSAGVCVAGALKDCADKDVCTLDSCGANGDCVNTLTNGLSCDDGDPCTATDLCDAGGKCAGSKISCDDGNPCTTDSCDSAIGCKTTAVADGASCDDGDKCTGDGTCLNAACSKGAAKVCKAEGICVTSFCDGATGNCVVAQAKIGTNCDDGDPCSLGDTCNSIGDCVAKSTGCDDGNPCTKDTCGATGCSFQGLTGACDDGDACTVGETCKTLDGVTSCESSQLKDCDDSNPCTKDTCAPSTGCSNDAITDATTCDDGDKCTEGEACKAGKCEGGKDVCSCSKDGDCDDSNPCTKDTCGGDKKCAFAAESDGAACDDGDKCTDDGKCKTTAGNSVCEKGATKSCDDSNPCTADSCDGKSGCVNAAKKDGDACDDGDKCTDSDACASGKCVGTPKKAEVTTLAGGGQGFKDGQGTSAQFNVPSGLVRDSAGNLYVADTTNHRIRKIDTTGKVTTLAGGPIAGQSNGTGGAASFRGPTGITIDDQGDLYVADTGNHLVRKVTAAGVVTTLAGSNTPGGFGQGPKGGFADGTGTAAKFDGLTALVWSGGALYVADTANHRIRKVTAAGVVTTFAGGASPGNADGKGAAAQFNGPQGITASGAGVLYVGDTGNHRLRVVQTDGTVTTLAGSTSGLADGKGTAAKFKQPMGLSLDALGQLLVCDSGNHQVRLVKADGTVSAYVGAGSADFGDGAFKDAKFDQPSAVVTDGKGTAWVADRGNHRVRQISDGPKTCAITNAP